MRADEIKDQESFEAWLNTRPVDTRRMELLAIAHRATLRLLPYALSKWGSRLPVESWLLVALRCAISTRSSLLVQALPDELCYELISTLYQVTAASGDTSLRTREDAILRQALRTLAQVIGEGLDERFRGERLSALHHSGSLDVYGSLPQSASLWMNISKDAAEVSNGMSATGLVNSDLWNLNIVPFEVAQFAGADWAKKLVNGSVLVEWYSYVDEGSPIFDIRSKAIREKLERNIALGSIDGTFKKEFWERDPPEINADIARWVAEARVQDGLERVSSSNAGNLPSQESVRQPHSSITQFTQGPDGRIAALADPLEPAKGRDLQDLEELYDDARSKALALQALGRNMLGGCFEVVEQLLAHTPEDFGLARVNRIHAKLSTLRDRVHLHELQMSKQAEDRDLALVLQEEVAVTLTSCVRQFNLLLAFDKRGQELNSLQHGPEARQRADETNKAVQSVVLNIGDIAEGATVTIIQGDNSNILSAPRDIHGDQAAVRSAMQNENLMMRIVQVGWSIAKETERQGLSEPTVQLAIAVGGQHGVKILEFIQRHDQAFLWLAQHVEAFQILGSLVLLLIAYAKVLGKADK